jgi:hypothetical protein
MRAHESLQIVSAGDQRVEHDPAVRARRKHEAGGDRKRGQGPDAAKPGRAARSLPLVAARLVAGFNRHGFSPKRAWTLTCEMRSPHGAVTAT